MKITHPTDFNPHSYKKKLIIDVTLYDEDEDSTRTKFYFNGEFKGYGIEDEQRDIKVKGETRIDNGIYKLDLRHSPKFSSSYYRDDEGNLIRPHLRSTNAQKERFHTKHELIWITETPRHEFCLIHWGNFESNTDGCYLVGGSLFSDPNRGRAVGGSRQKYEEIYPIVWRTLRKDKLEVLMNFDR